MEPEKSVELQEKTVNENGELNDQELDQVAGGSIWGSITHGLESAGGAVGSVITHIADSPVLNPHPLTPGGQV